VAFNSNRVMVGTNGYLWLNGILLSQIKKVEAKVTGSFEEIGVCGNYGTPFVYTGWSGEGTITLQKIDSTAMKIMGDSYQKGIMPELKIISKLTNRATGKSERAAMLDVVFTEFYLANFESKGLIEEAMPFKFGDYQILELI
jgi:hypothetical protein